MTSSPEPSAPPFVRKRSRRTARGWPLWLASDNRIIVEEINE